MKKAFSLFLTLCLFFTGCATAQSTPSINISSALTASSVPASIQPQSSGVLSQDQSSSEINSIPAKTDTVTSESGFWIRFLDVGQADSALVMCGGKYMLIDGGNVADSSLVYSCLKTQGVKTLDYVVCTHGHEDHVGGLPGALNACGVKTVLSSCNSFDSDAFRSFVKYVGQAGAQITIPEVGSEYTLGDAKFTILSPSRRYEDENDNSVALRLVYGDNSFLFMGDAGREAELDILNGKFTLKSDLIKIGHHGSETSSSYVFLREVMPQYAVISVGKNNTYGHPDEAVLSRLRDADITVFRTDQSGDILVQSDGKKLTISNSTVKGISETSLPMVSVSQTSSESSGYIGNSKTKVVHLASCGNLPDPGNRVYFTTLEAALAQGYTLCGLCHPEAGVSPQSSAQSPSMNDMPVNAGQGVFIGNKNSKKVHLPSCFYLPDEQNRVYFHTFQEAVSAGYNPCQKCHPDK